MEMIATSKVQRATRMVLQARAYAAHARRLASQLSYLTSPYFEERRVRRVAIVLFTADRGLCGAFNTSCLRTLTQRVAEHRAAGKEVVFITAGKKGRDFIGRIAPENLSADFTGIRDEILFEEITPIAHLIKSEFLQGNLDLVEGAYTHFVSTFVQEPRLVQLLPIKRPEEARERFEYKIEPKAEEVFDVLLPHLIDVELFALALESKASEHAARMLAMRAATENADDLLNDLTLTYHSSRQATITRELSEITTAKRAIEGEV